MGALVGKMNKSLCPRPADCPGSPFETPEPNVEEVNDEEVLDSSFEGINGKDWLEKVKSVGKLLMIIFCYATAFISIIQFGFRMAETIPHVQPLPFIQQRTDLITWLEEKWEHGIWWDTDTKALFINLSLLLAFCLQHSLMSQRILDGTAYWFHLHYIYKIDRPIYVLATAVVLQGILRLWTTVPVIIWTVPILVDFYKYIHLFAWISLYGTSLMLDLPDMVGFNQVVISSPNVTSKSPDLQIMYKTQRHMGFIPFVLILACHPYMTLDRFILMMCTSLYTYFCWRSPSCYDYASKMKSMKRRPVE